MIEKFAVWALTPQGVGLARRIAAGLGRADCFAPRQAAVDGCQPFDGLRSAVTGAFGRYRGHVFVMAAGIVVRLIAPLLRHKSVDPAVVVVDEAGRWAVSLVSGHIGGANRLAEETAGICGARAVITTATDVHGLPAVDAIAAERGLAIENPATIKTVSMALLAGETIDFFDPGGWFDGALAPSLCRVAPQETGPLAAGNAGRPGVWVDDRCLDLPSGILVLRPPSLVAGVGCNRHTAAGEILDLIHQALARHRLSPLSLALLATIDIKADEPGLREAAARLGVGLSVYRREELARVEGVANPSAVVQKHVGVGSVCEAAAILGARGGELIVPKHKTANATVAIARRDCTSWASDPGPRSTFPNGPAPS